MWNQNSRGNNIEVDIFAIPCDIEMW